MGYRCSSDPALLCLWRRLAATAPIGPLAWEPPYAVGAALDKTKRPKKKKKVVMTNIYAVLISSAHQPKIYVSIYLITFSLSFQKI